MHRFHGGKPYRAILFHGGPGAIGDMNSVAHELSKEFGVIEHLQSKLTIAEELSVVKELIELNVEKPISVIGYSWGAWFAYIFTANYPELVRKVILVGSGPFEESYTANLMETRLSRLSSVEQCRVHKILKKLKKENATSREIQEFGKLMAKADTFSEIEENYELSEFRKDIYEKIWAEASELRRSGELLKIGRKIKKPVIAIHGIYDSHPAEGVRIPLEKNIKRFKMILLDKCGHTPWKEKYAKVKFYQKINAELNN